MKPAPNPSSKKTIIAGSSRTGSADSIHLKAFNNSLQPNIIFIVSDGQIIQANQAACKLLGYSKKLLLTKKREDIFDLSGEGYTAMLKERDVEGFVKVDISLINKSGKTIPCEITSVLFNDSEGIPNSILSIVDLRERLLKQHEIDLEHEKASATSIAMVRSIADKRQAKENINWIKSIAKTSYDIIWDWNIDTDIISFGKNYAKVFGYQLVESKVSFSAWMKKFRPKERKIIKEKMNGILTSKNNSWEGTYPFTNAEGIAREVTSRANILRNDKGAITRVIGVIHDLS